MPGKYGNYIVESAEALSSPRGGRGGNQRFAEPDLAFPGPGVTGTGCISEGCRGFLLPQTLNGDTESAEHGEEWTDHQIQCDERCTTEKAGTDRAGNGAGVPDP